jgi:hypothetical protein
LLVLMKLFITKQVSQTVSSWFTERDLESINLSQRNTCFVCFDRLIQISFKSSKMWHLHETRFLTLIKTLFLNRLDWLWSEQSVSEIPWIATGEHRLSFFSWQNVTTSINEKVERLAQIKNVMFYRDWFIGERTINPVCQTGRSRNNWRALRYIIDYADFNARLRIGVG